MARQNVALLAFNRGRISRLALARTDIDRVSLSADVQTNWMPRILGSMMLRPGWGYMGSTYQDRKAYYINFIYALSDQAEIEFTDGLMRVIINDDPVDRDAVSTSITNGTFTADLSGWTDSDESGATSSWATGGYMQLLGNGVNSAIRRQQVTVSGGDIGSEHGIRVVVARGEVRLKIGSTSGGGEYVPEATLRGEGVYSFSVIPTGDIHITLSSSKKYPTLIDSISVEGGGDMTIPTPYSEGDLSYIRYDQSGDVIYVACNGIKQQKIERRATRSWGISDYISEDGPFMAQNLSSITITPSALSGDITLTASKDLFTEDSVGAIYRITATGQTVSSAIASDNTFTDPIRVTGVGASSRTFTYTITGTWVGTIRIQKSVGDIGAWEDITAAGPYTSNFSSTLSDGLDNQVIYYRMGFKTGAYTSGTATCTLVYSLGTNSGVARIYSYSTPKLVNAYVLEDMGGTAATTDWEEGQWSPRRGFSSSVALDEGRLWWGGKDKISGSVSDAYESYDDTIEGNSGPIVRSIGSGPVDRINWLLALQRLVLGAETSEKIVRSNSLDEPLSPTVFNIKTPSTRGSTAVNPIKVDESGFFARNNRLFQLEYDPGSFDYKTVDMTSAVPEIGESGFVKLAVQRYPDTRIHGVKNDGTAAILIFDRNEDMKCWIDITTDGIIEDVIVKPAISDAIEDTVYYIVKRTINGATVRYREKFALESECVGGTLNKQADAFVSGTQSSSATITGLSHLEGAAVIVWADGINYSPRVNGVQTTFTVSGGQITLPSAVTSYVVGLPYKAQYKSSRLAYASQGGTALLQSKRIETLGVIMVDTHNRGLRYGRDFDNLHEMPLVEGGAAVSANQIWEEYDERPFEFEQEFDTDSRLCLEAMAPMPCTLLAAVMKVATNDRV